MIYFKNLNAKIIMIKVNHYKQNYILLFKLNIIYFNDYIVVINIYYKIPFELE